MKINSGLLRKPYGTESKGAQRSLNNDMESDSWFIVVTLAIFFFLYQWMEIYSVTVVMGCDKLATFWLDDLNPIFSPFLMVVYIFTLIFVWSLVDVIRAVSLKFGDKIQAGVIFVGVLVCTVFVARSLWAQWELLEVEHGNLKAEESIYLNVKGNYFSSERDPWREFIRSRKCEDPSRSLNINSSEGWKKLEAEFILKGAKLP